LKRTPLPSSATTSWAGTSSSCGQSSWAYSGSIGQLIGLLLVLLLPLLSHGSGGRGEDAWELTVGTCELLEGEVRIRNGCFEEQAGGARGAQRRRRRSAGVLIRTFSWRAWTLAWVAGAESGGSWRNEKKAALARVRRARVKFQSELSGISRGVRH